MTNADHCCRNSSVTGSYHSETFHLSPDHSLRVMEDLLSRHRKEQKDLQSQITQKKKSASKKTRKGVNDECSRLEEDLKARHQQEIASCNDSSALTAETVGTGAAAVSPKESDDDDDLLAALAGSTIAQPQTPHTDPASTGDDLGDDDETSTSAAGSRKPNRQKARLARRAAEQEAVAKQAAAEASNLPDMKERERARMLEEFEKRSLKEKVVAANGHCMYSAIADQMKQLGRSLAQGSDDKQDKTTKEQDDVGEKELRNDDYKVVRQAAASYISHNPNDFEPFLEEPLQEYIHKIKDTGEWGGQLELMALAKTYGIDINVLQGDGRVEKIEGGTGADSPVAWLAYYRHGFGLGEHYNSLRKS
jgi:OTU domain-containing protein 6